MFNQKDTSTGAEIDTLIGPGSTVKGDIRFAAGLHVDGVVDGSILADGPAVLIVSDQGRVEGRIEVPNVVIDGQVEGDVVASDRVELRANAKVQGNIEYGSIQMAFGAQVNGKLTTRPAKAAPAAAKSEAKKSNA